jgi:hypothetical protein
MMVVLTQIQKVDESKPKLIGLTGFSIGFSRSRRKVVKNENGQKMSKRIVMAFATYM